MPMFQSLRYRWQRYIWSVILVGATTLLSVPVHRFVSPTNLVMLYLAVVVIAAIYLGRGPAALAAIPEAAAGFDGVLLDVPCSNTGVLRRRADARWRFNQTRLRQLTATQRAILDAASTLVRPGGRLVYSTCSLEPEENENQIRGWLSSHPDFALETEHTLFPPDARTDGGYAVRLRFGNPNRELPNA